jgi:type VI secretion system protein ImpJ
VTWHSKVIWSEGMFLQPQHFQQQDRHAEHRLQARTAPLLPNAWGFSELALDGAALALGKVQIARARGLMPDGTPFDIPQSDPPPPALDIDPSVRNEIIVLSLALRRPGMPESQPASADGSLTRYGVLETDTADSAAADGASALLQLGTLSLRLQRQRDAADGVCTLGVAQVDERKADNTLVLKRDYVPPLLEAGADPVLGGYIADLQGRLHQLGEALAKSLGTPGRGGVAEIAEFLMLQTVNRHEPLFTRLAGGARVHPERLYELCLQLGGDLSVFNPAGRRPGAAPGYRHDDLRATFAPLMADLRHLLSLRPDKGAEAIELQEKRFGVRVAVIGDPALLQESNLVLAVNAQLPPDALRARFPTQVKIGPSEKIRDLVNLQLPGIALNALAVAPRQIPYHAGFAYFELDRSGELWKQLQKSGSLALHVAGDFPGLELELWAVRP